MLAVDGAGPPLLLVHGLTDSADTWRPVLQRLARAGRRGAAIDLPGFGAAAPARPGPVPPQLAAVVTAAAARIGGDDPVVIAGHSMGGMVTLYAANRGGLALAGIVPIGTAGLHHPRWIHAIGSPFLREVLPLLAA